MKLLQIIIDPWYVLWESSHLLVIFSCITLVFGMTGIELAYYKTHQKMFQKISYWGNRWDDVGLTWICGLSLFMGIPYSLIEENNLELFNPLMSFFIGLSGQAISFIVLELILSNVADWLKRFKK